MFGSQSRPTTPGNAPAKEVPKMADQGAPRQLKPTEPVSKTAAPPSPADKSPAQHETEPQSYPRSTEADVRTLIIGPGVSVKGEITSCNRLIVEGKIEAKLADCPNVIIKEGGGFNGESTTENAEVQGSFDGNLVVRGRLLVQATGRLSGKIAYGDIEIERGGKIYGEISNEEVSRLKSVQVG